MFKPIAFAAAAATVFGVAFASLVEASETSAPTSTYAPIGAETSVPYGWVDFCGRRPEECNVQRLPALDVRLTDRAWQALDSVNRSVNAAIEPVSNLQHWGT